jgi:hypothetical protein
VLDMMGVSKAGTAARHQAWQLVRGICEEMQREGLLDGARLEDYLLPVYERSADEVRRPFGEAIGACLRLERLALVPVPSPFTERYRADGDAGALAAASSGSSGPSASRACVTGWGSTTARSRSCSSGWRRGSRPRRLGSSSTCTR